MARIADHVRGVQLSELIDLAAARQGGVAEGLLIGAGLQMGSQALPKLAAREISQSIEAVPMP